MLINNAIQFEQKLYDLINTCGLPVDTAFFILKSVYLDFQNTLLEYARTEEDEIAHEKETILDLDPKQTSVTNMKRKEIMENDDTINRDNA